MVFLSFPLAPCTEYLCSLFLFFKVVFEKGVENGMKAVQANKIQCIIQCQRKFFVKYSFERRSNSKDLY